MMPKIAFNKFHTGSTWRQTVTEFKKNYLDGEFCRRKLGRCRISQEHTTVQVNISFEIPQTIISCAFLFYLFIVSKLQIQPYVNSMYKQQLS